MKRFVVTPVAAALLVAACSDSPAGLVGEIGIDEIVLTHGIPAPEPKLATPSAPALSTLQDASVSVGGSSTTPLSINGANCSTFPAQQVVITYSVHGNQASNASFKVNTLWNYDGTSFVGSNPTTVNVPAASGSPRTHQVTVQLTNSSETGTGSTSFVVEPFDLVTNMSDPSGQRLGFGASSSATIHVAFNDCTPSNTAPSLTLPADQTVEATSSSGAAVTFVVSATDAEDGDLTGSIVCKVGSTVVTSGDIFPLGESTVECSVTDTGGETASGSFEVNVRDITAPVFTSFPANQTLFATDIHGRSLDLSDYAITAEDKGPQGQAGDISGPVTISCKIGSVGADGYQIEIGQTVTVSCTATDNSQHPSPNTSGANTFDVAVTLDVTGSNGFLTPLRMSAPFSAHKRGSAVPHKLPAPKYADGTPATDLAGGLKLAMRRVGNPTEEYNSVDEDLSAGSTAWRWEAVGPFYIFNAKTGSSWNAGEWETEVSYAGVVLAKTKFELRR